MTIWRYWAFGMDPVRLVWPYTGQRKLDTYRMPGAFLEEVLFAIVVERLMYLLYIPNDSRSLP